MTDAALVEPTALSFANLLVRFTKVWEDFVEVQWKRQIFDGRRIVKYHLVAVARDYRVERFLESGDTSFRLPGLSPSTELEVAVRMQLDAGANSDATWSAWETAVVTTLAAVSIEVSHVHPTAIQGVVKWGDSALLRQGATPTATALRVEKFQVRVEQRGRVVAHSLPDQEFAVGIDRNPEAFAFGIDGLDRNASFFVRARAMGPHGDPGRWCPPVKFITLDPVGIEVGNVAENEVVLQWGRGEDDDQTMSDGAIEEIVVVVEQVPDQRELDLDANAANHRVDAQAFANETRKYRVRSLMPGRQYVLRSRYRNTLGNHSDWKVIPFRTLYPMAPVDVQLVGHNFIQVKWGRELPPDTPAELAAESVSEWEVRCSVGGASTSVRLPADETETKLMNLLHGVDYTVDVRAITPFGHAGLWSPPVAVTTLHRLVPRVTHSGESWLNVAWDRKEKRFEDNIERYHLQLNCATSPFRLAKYFPASTTAYSIENLKPDTTYIVMIQAFSDERWGPWSEPVTVRTCAPCVPQLVRRGEDFVQVKWDCEYYRRCAVDPTQQKYQVRVRKPTQEAFAAGEASAPPAEEKVIDVDTAAHRFIHLAAFSRLLLQVRGFDYTQQAWCAWGKEVEYRTLPAVIVLTHVGETHAEISWPRLPRMLSAITDEQAAAGAEDPLSPDAAKQYVIRVNRVDQNRVHREIAKHHFDGAEATAFSISELSSDSDFSVQLSYCDVQNRWSNDSSPVCFRTLPPLRVAVRDVGEAYVSLRWGRWHAGDKLLLRPEEADLNYRVQVARVLTPEELAQPWGSAAAVAKQYNVSGKCAFTATGLDPSALYRVQVSSSTKTSSVWGTWSEATYVRTTHALTTTVDLIGQDFAVVSWTRPERSTAALQQLPGAVFALADFNNKQPMPAAPASCEEGDRGGEVVHYGDDTVTEHHVQVYRVDPPAEPQLDPTPTRTLVFDAKRDPSEATVRVAGLAPNAVYAVHARSMFASKQWGVWSAPLEFRTTMPTKVRITEVTQEALTVSWGNAGLYDDNAVITSAAEAKARALVKAADTDALEHQLLVEGLDDDFALTRTVDASVHSFELKGLNAQGTYSFTVRSFLKSDNNWGAWCDKIYVTLSTTPLALAETSQTWLHLQWSGKAPADGRPKRQFLTVVGEGKCTQFTLGATETDYVVPNLTPNTKYLVHLLNVEQRPTYWSPESDPERKARLAKDAKHTAITSREAPTAANAAALGVKDATDAVDGVSFSLPLVSADTAHFARNGLVLRTFRQLECYIDRVGQNFVLLRWTAKRAPGETGEVPVPGELFEVETVAVDGDEPPRYQRVQGSHAFVRHLAPDSEVRCAVRGVATRTEALCAWSNPCSVRLLPMIDPMLGAGDGTDVPGVGEDYAIVNWSRALARFAPERLQGVAFEVRITPLEGPTAHVEQTFETSQPRYHCKGLLPDTKYRIQVRTVIAHRNAETGECEVAKGEWSQPLIITTLSPMSVALSEITETSSHVHWRRRNCAVGDAWWSTADAETLRAETATISSFHVRVTEAAAAPDAAPFFDEQFGEHHPEYQTCCAALKGLKANTEYLVAVRASTGRLWGGWSAPSAFRTMEPVRVELRCPVETSVIVEWRRPAPSASATAPQDDDAEQAAAEALLPVPAVLAEVESWEVSFRGVGPDHAPSPPGASSSATNSGAATAMVTPVAAMIPSQFTAQRIGSLQPNTPYSVCVRALYVSGQKGPWSELAYFATLPPFRVDVGKVGETFVNVSWVREPQQTVSMRLKSRSLDADRRLDAQLRELEEERGRIASRNASEAADTFAVDDAAHPATEEAPLDLDGLDAPSPAAAPARRADTAGADTTARLAAIDRSITAVQRRSADSRRLLHQHCAELERQVVYGKGDDVRYELVVYIGSFGRGGEEPAEPQVLLRKRAGRGEDHLRLESLTPKTTYYVTVRALHASAGGAQLPPALHHQVGDVDEETLAPWGEWSERTAFTTLKPITIKAHGVGSTSFSVEWDTGVGATAGSSKTAISKFQVRCADVAKQLPAVPEVVLHDASLKGHVLGGLQPRTVYSASVRVCYDGDKWGVWSAPVQFITLAPLVAKLEMTGERQIDFLVWRDTQAEVADPASTLVWRPTTTVHQLAINGVPCADTFEIEEGTSTELTLDTLQLDTEYVIGVRDLVDGTWQEFVTALHGETLAHVPQRPTLVERKGTNVAIAWEHLQQLPEKQYVYMVEIALVEESTRAVGRAGGVVRRAEPGPWQTLGFTTACEFRLELPFPIHVCAFRVRAAKTNLTIDGVPAYVAGFVPGKPRPPLGPVSIDNPHMYRWSGVSPVARFKTPSVPDHPTGIHVRNLTHNSALIKWQRPANYAEHSSLLYRVYLNNSYVDRFTCVKETEDCQCQLDDLVPNTHYRVAVTAESTMGRSTDNNTLHFSTRALPKLGDPVAMQRKPMASTLPPRTVIRPPAAFVKLAAKDKAKAGSPLEEVGDMLIDDAGSTIYAMNSRMSAAAHGRARSPPEGEPRSPASPAAGQPSSRAATPQAPPAQLRPRVKKVLPPLPSDYHRPPASR